MAQIVIKIGPDHKLTTEEVEQVSYNKNIKVQLSEKAKKAVQKACLTVEKMVKEERIIYGVTTGFGSFKNKIISTQELSHLQKNLLRSHSVGVGPLLPAEIVRASLLVRLNSLSQGYSGVSLNLLELICQMLNKNVIPVVPSQGSVGSSGDLAPLSHMGLVLMGEGKAYYKGEIMAGASALRKAGLKPHTFGPKEGLAFNNGTSVMTGISALVISNSRRIANLADMACALSLESVCGISKAFDEKIQNLRPHPGQKKAAENIRKFIIGSKLVDSVPGRIQDGYSLRCTPQVHGAAREALTYAGEVIGRELNSVTDNPLIFPDDDEAVSGGNFHGEPVAIAMDAAGIALAEIADISERRIARLLNSETNEGLPLFLTNTKHAGLNSGLMMPQYTAAALVSENKVLAHPASVDSIPTSANQEDHVSMGTIAARKCFNIMQNVENVLAIEFFTACQALNFRGSSKLGKFTKKTFHLVRDVVPKVEEDRVMADDFVKIKGLFKTIEGIINR